MGLLVAAHEAGRLVLARWPLPGAGRLEAALLRLAAGCGALSLAGLGLGLAGLLQRPAAVAGIAVLLLAAVVRHRGLLQRPSGSARWIRTWLDGGRALPLGRLEWFWVGSALTVTFAALAQALAPEVQSDAARVHLALARRFAEDGEIAVLEQFRVTRWPLLVQTLYTLGVLVHDPITAKLLHAAAGVGFALTAGIAAGKLCGPRAAVLAGALVATLPLVAQLMGTAYVDLFAAWLGLLATVALINWQQTGARSWPWLAGACGGLAIAAKLTAAVLVVGLVLALVLVGRRRGAARERLAGVARFSAGFSITAGPWLGRSVLATGSLPGVSIFLDAVSYRDGPAPASLMNLPGFGTGQSLPALLRLPWDLSFRTALFGENLDGYAGMALLGLLPLVLLVPRGRVALGAASVTAVTTLVWFFTAQYLRYLLPAIGLLAVLPAAGFARFSTRAAAGAGSPGSAVRWSLWSYRLFLWGALGSAPVFFLATLCLVYPGSLPVRLVAALETPRQYLDRQVASYEVLRRLDTLVPKHAPVVMLPDGPQLYSHARLISNMTGGEWILSAPSPEALLERLAEHRAEYLVLDSVALPPSWSGAAVLQDGFLVPYCRFVYSANGVHLYRVVFGAGSHEGLGRPVDLGVETSTEPASGLD